MPTKQPDLSIVIPAYCEERRVGKTLDELAWFLRHDAFFKAKDVEVIVVVASAPDRTRAIVQSKRALFKHFLLLEPGPRVGKGRDVQYGMIRAHGKYVVFMDADLATPLRHLQAFYLTCEHGSDVVIGTRDHTLRHPVLGRRKISGLGNALFTLFSGVKVTDTQCGFKMFNERASKLCFSMLTIPGWWFDMEILTIARANNLKIKTITVDGWQAMPFSTYTVSSRQIITSFIADMTHIVWNRLNRAYKG